MSNTRPTTTTDGPSPSGIARPRSAALVLAAVLAAALGPAALADPPGNETPGVRLKWLPHRQATSGPIQRVALTEPADGPGLRPSFNPVRQANANPMDDPFGDGRQGAVQAGPLASASQERAAQPGTLPDAAAPPKGAAPGPLPMADDRTPPPTRPGASKEVRARCLAPRDLLIPIEHLTTSTDVDPQVHRDLTAEEVRRMIDTKKDFDAKMWCVLPENAHPERMTTGWSPTTFTWKASALCHKPLYFEQAHVERYGHTTGPLTQPIVSAGIFFLTVPVLPYEMGLWPPYECMYSLGYYRPGSCAPYYLDPVPLSVRAALAEAGVWVGGIYALP